MPKERVDQRIWIIGNTFLTVFFITMLVPPSTGQAKKYNATIHDYTVDNEMYDNCTNKNFTQYCQKTGDCETGTHVMCMYYKTGMVMGPQCENGKMFRLNQEIRNFIIEELAKIRDDVIEGTARGREDVELPRAYDLRRRLQWDFELAFFAQIWANQCQHALDFCRSTLTFDNPEQFVGIDTFTHPEWRSISRNERVRDMENYCLTTSKVKDAIKAIIALLEERGRVQTTADMIEVYRGGPRNTYLNMLYHNTTHIGCGMSHYLGYQRLDEPRKHDVFVLQLVCNLSHRPIVGEMIYNTTRPQDFVEPTTPTPTEPTVPTPSDPAIISPPTTDANSNSKSGNIPGMRKLVPGGRGPGVLIMPIITVEDAPPELIQQRNFALRRSSGSVSQSNYNKFGNNNQQTKIAPYSRKNSVFARAPIFNLSPRNQDDTSKANLEEKTSLKKQLKTLLDQVPRREIPRLRELLKQMVKKHKSEENHTPRLGPVEIESHTQELVPEQFNHVPPNDAADGELLRLTNSKFKEITHGSRLIGSDTANMPSDTDIVVIQDATVGFDTQSEFEIPIIRKQKPIVHAKKKEKPKKKGHRQSVSQGLQYSTKARK
ncbi:uncharacterized protein LOC133529673 [Cydia pomonella]|uniref:uncharacterized protein LOC133529673 n=1 Tax=Cydia pomonella TaxID=82600 RepID=UPI002ADDC5DD|nr:uncharacterized protein LOC133529673 [Cydia pomonella]